jgi:hypothetical protein
MKYTSVKVCGYAAEKIRKPCFAYDRVDIAKVTDVLKMVAEERRKRPIEEALRRLTIRYVHNKRYVNYILTIYYSYFNTD